MARRLVNLFSVTKGKKQMSCFQQFWQPGLQPGTSQDVKPFSQPAYTGKPATAVSSGDMVQAQPPPPWEGRAIATHKLRLVEFSAYMEQQRDQDIVSTPAQNKMAANIQLDCQMNGHLLRTESGKKYGW